VLGAQLTHQSLAPHLLEEPYEAVDALESGDEQAFCEELGDVLLQVVFHARVAAERADGYTIDDVADGIVAKLVRRASARVRRRDGLRRGRGLPQAQAGQPIPARTSAVSCSDWRRRSGRRDTIRRWSCARPPAVIATLCAPGSGPVPAD
jgi:NTP pyrophosphatase (non-canonical NTP hydrolase)